LAQVQDQLVDAKEELIDRLTAENERGIVS
jgi:hypothetical protein